MSKDQDASRQSDLFKTPQHRATLADHVTCQIRELPFEGRLQAEARFSECGAAARATHNELFPLLLDSMVDTGVKVRQVAFDVPGMPARAFHHHRAIPEQAKAGDLEGTRQAKRKHLTECEGVPNVPSMSQHLIENLDNLEVIR